MKNKAKEKITEARLAAALIAVITQDGWDCYSEVQVESYGHRADVVAVKNGIVWVFECKLTANMDVLGQALRWVGRAHFVSICTPYGGINDPWSNRGKFIVDWIKGHGIGWLPIDVEPVEKAISDPRRSGSVHKLTGYGCRSINDLEPRLNRSAHENAKKLRAGLYSDMNNYVAGSGGSAYSTPFKRTMQDFDQHIQRFPGEELGVLIERVQHHYNTRTSAIACIGNVVMSLKEKYRTEGSGRSMKVFPVENDS